MIFETKLENKCKIHENRKRFHKNSQINVFPKVVKNHDSYQHHALKSWRYEFMEISRYIVIHFILEGFFRIVNFLTLNNFSKNIYLRLKSTDAYFLSKLHKDDYIITFLLTFKIDQIFRKLAIFAGLWNDSPDKYAPHLSSFET